MANWKDLSLKDKAEYIRSAVRNGIYNLGDIQKDYETNLQKFAEGGPKNTQEELKKVDFQEWFDQEGNRDRAVNIPAMEQLQDSLIARRFNLPQRLAILGTAAQEMDQRGAATIGVGGRGYLGLSSQRMPDEYLDDTPKGRGKQIHFLMNDLLTTHSDNWLDGGTGGPTIRSGKDGYNQFWNSPSVWDATMILNKSYIRPRDRVPSWTNRANVAKAMQKHMYLPSERNKKK